MDCVAEWSHATRRTLLVANVVGWPRITCMSILIFLSYCWGIITLGTLVLLDYFLKAGDYLGKRSWRSYQPRVRVAGTVWFSL